MNKREFEIWQAVTEESKDRWVCDEITLLNRGEYLFYTGGEIGNFIRVNSDGVAKIGLYAGAIPHIGEALFHDNYSKKLADNAEEALVIVTTKLGTEFLLDLIKPI